MPFDSYQSLQESVLSFLGRPADALIPTADLVALFEADANRKLKTRQMEASTTIDIVTGQASYDLPDDFLEARYVKIISVTPAYGLEYMSSDHLDEHWPFTCGEQPVNYTIEGSQIRFAPYPPPPAPGDTPTVAWTVQLNYWAKIPPLGDSSYAISTIAVAAGGTGYAVNDTLIVSGGIPSVAALIAVDTVDEDGVILTGHAAQVGSYTVVPGNPVATTDSSAGSGATFTITWATNGGQTNWLLTDYPDLYLFGALAEAEIYLGSDTSDARFAAFISRREAIYQSIRLADRQFKIGSAPLVMRIDGTTP